MFRLLHEQYSFFGTWLEIISGCPSKHPVLSRLQILKRSLELQSLARHH